MRSPVNFRFIGVVAAIAVLLTAGAYAFTFVTLRDGAPREVVLVAKNMAFVSDRAAADPTLNPTIVLHAGERVRLVVRNEDAGMKHDLVLEPIDLRTAALEFGESGGFVFRVPDEKGEGDYYCSFHSQMMRGRFVIQ